MSARVNQDAIAASHYCSRLLLELPHPVLILDAAGRITYLNAAADILLRPRIPLLGRRFDEGPLFGRGAVTRVLDEHGWTAEVLGANPLRTLVDSGDAATSVHVRIDRLDGPRLMLSVDIVPLHTDIGGRMGTGLVLRDETEDVARRSEEEWMRSELLESRRTIEEILGYSEALNSIGATIHSTLDFDEVLRRVVNDSTRALAADSGVIVLREGDGWVLRFGSGVPDTILGRRFTAEEAEPATLAAESRTPVTRTFGAAGAEGGFVPGSTVRTLLTVPLLTRDEAVGALSFQRTEPVEFSGEQVGFAMRVATTTALAMENARIYREEHHIADTLQRTLLVVPERVRGVDFHHRYQSATEAAWVGGDFFDVFELPEDRVALVIGDVSGKGIEASALASFTRQLLKAHTLDGLSPAEAIERTNDLVFRTSRTEDFVTLFVGVLSLADGELTFCDAGHPPPIVRRQDHADVLHDGGSLTGAWHGLQWENHKTRLAPGEVILLYTDGVIEAKRDGQLYGEERLRSLVESLPRAPLDELTAEVLRDVTAFAEGHLRDDVALLLVSPT